MSWFPSSDSTVVLGAGVALAVIVAAKYMNASADAANARAYEAAKARQEKAKQEDQAKRDAIERRFFTEDELLAFNGEDDKPIYISLLDEVYDVSSKRDFYGPGEGYHLFAGHDASRALAKMSFEPEDLASAELSDLTFMENETLQDWVMKFSVYNHYPSVGRLLRKQDLTREQLAKFDGVANPRKTVYVALNGFVYDVTLSGLAHYGPEGSYKQFAGKDASRALACMSFKDECLSDPTLTDLTDAQWKTLRDWESKFQGKYPVVGKLLA